MVKIDEATKRIFQQRAQSGWKSGVIVSQIARRAFQYTNRAAAISRWRYKRYAYNPYTHTVYNDSGQPEYRVFLGGGGSSAGAGAGDYALSPPTPQSGRKKRFQFEDWIDLLDKAAQAQRLANIAKQQHRFSQAYRLRQEADDLTEQVNRVRQSYRYGRYMLQAHRFKNPPRTKPWAGRFARPLKGINKFRVIRTSRRRRITPPDGDNNRQKYYGHDASIYIQTEALRKKRRKNRQKGQWYDYSKKNASTRPYYTRHNFRRLG